MGGAFIRTDGGHYALPRLKDEPGKDLATGSPEAILNLWVAALRQRFGDDIGEPMPWVWTPDLKPSQYENAQPRSESAGEPRKLLIEVESYVEGGVRNYRPAIYVGRGEVVPQKSVVDNRAGQHLPTGLIAYWCKGSMPISFLVEGESGAESSVIAETAWFFVMATRDIWRRDFGIDDISMPVLGVTQQATSDKEVWQTTVSFVCEITFRWMTRPIATKIRDFSLQVTRETAGEPSPGLELRELDMKGPGIIK